MLIMLTNASVYVLDSHFFIAGLMYFFVGGCNILSFKFISNSAIFQVDI